MTTDIDLPADRSATRLLVGRDRELTGILGCLDRAQAGRGSLAMVVGAPGIGKSRFVDEVASVATQRGFRVLWGRCWDTAGAPPYWPWVQALRAYLRTTDADDLRAQLGTGAADVAQMLPELRELFPDLQPPPATDPESARFQLFDSISTFLLNASRPAGMVVVIDDLHSADLASILLLLFVSKQGRESPLLLVATYRDEELTPDHPLSGALPDLAREPSTVFFELLGLTEASTSAFVEELAGFEPRPAVVRALHKSTSGNPLFIRETIRLLLAEGRLTAGSGSDSLSSTVIPGRVHEVIARRLTHVTEASRELMMVAAVLGPEFSIDALRVVTDAAEDEVLDRLDETVEAWLMVAVPGAPGRFRFSHDLVRETLYADISPTTRARLHRRIALALEELYGPDADAHLGELAHHFFEAGSTIEEPRAVEYALRAGHQASRQLAYGEAARLFGMALSALQARPPVDQRVLGDVLLAFGEVQDKSGEPAESRATFRQAADTARSSGAADQLARAAIGYGGRFPWGRAGNDTHLVPLLRDALDMLGGQDERLRARLLSRLACALRSEPNREPNDALSQQAVDLARTLDDPATLAYALEGRFYAIWWPETTEQRLSIAQELRVVAEAAGDSERLSGSHVVTYCVLGDLGRIREASVEAEIAVRLAQELGEPAQRWLSTVLLSTPLLLEGRFSEAEKYIDENLAAGRFERDEVSSTRSQAFLLRREQDRLAEMVDVNLASIDAFPWYPVHRAERALLLIETGRRSEAQALLSALARDDFAVFHRDNEWLFGMAITSEVASRLGDVRAAAVLSEQLAPFRELHAAGWAEGSFGAVSRYLGLLAETLGQLDDAVGHLEHAEQFNDRMGARPWTARTRADLARVLRRRAQPDDAARAAALAAQARGEADEMGMVALLKQLAADAEAVTGPGAAKEPMPRDARAITEHTFRREGDHWLVEFDGSTVRVRDSKGMGYLARLLADPGREVHVLDLAGAPGATGGTAATTAAGGDDLATDGLGDAGVRLDPQAKAEYRRRVDELRSEIVEAEEWNDPERAARARDELAFVTQELAGAVGLGGRDRKAASASERARVSVTRAVRSAMVRLRVLDAPLGAHLDATIRTGTYCAYVPDPRAPVRWVV